MTDPISHPGHYTSHPSGVECIDVVRHLPACWSNVIKYLWRSDLKNGPEDMRKALQYAQWIDVLSIQLIDHLPRAAYPNLKISAVLAVERTPRGEDDTPLFLALDALMKARVGEAELARKILARLIYQLDPAVPF